jgi:hypothetical protein
MLLFNSKHNAGDSFANDYSRKAQYFFCYVGLYKNALVSNFKAIFKSFNYCIYRYCTGF